MLEILQFIFSSFWIWLGTLMLVSVIAGCIANIRLVTWKYVLPKPEETLLRQMITDQVKKQMEATVVKHIDAIASMVHDMEKKNRDG